MNGNREGKTMFVIDYFVLYYNTELPKLLHSMLLLLRNSLATVVARAPDTYFMNISIIVKKRGFLRFPRTD